MSKEALKLQKFGRYLLLDHLVDGGMAQIFRARYLSEEAKKIVAIKMIREQFSNDESFKSMFMNEIKVTFALNHPNIAQTYDYGILDGKLYTAMEYVDGANLKQFLLRLKKRNYAFPIEITCYIISQMCQGLNYAHHLTDNFSGKKINIIHRDISPHNVMVTWDGAVKIIDFGIAKAETNTDATQAGTIKGKLSYIAPEYVDGKDLDHRYDQFAVGITFWELLCNRKLFRANNDLAILKKVQSCQITPPSHINPNVPKELDEIVLTALNKDRNLRYKNLDQMNRAIVKFLYSRYSEFNPTDLAYFAKELFKEDIQKDRKRLVQFGKVDVSPYIHSDGSVQSVVREENRREIEMEENLEQATRDITLAVEETKSPSHSKTRIQKTLSQRNATHESTRFSTVTVNRPQQREDATKGTSHHKYYIIAASIVFALFLFRGPLTSLLHSSEQGEPLVSTQIPKARLIIQGLDLLTDLYINGELTIYTGIALELPQNQEVEIRVEKEGHLSYNTQVSFTPEDEEKLIVIPKLKEAKYGELSAANIYSDGSFLKIQVDGEVVQKKMPFKNWRLPAGSYDAMIKNPNIDFEKPIKIVIEENKREFIE